jgi:hypothetical protein
VIGTPAEQINEHFQNSLALLLSWSLVTKGGIHVSVSVDRHKLPDETQALKISTNALIFRKQLSTKRYVMVALRYIARIVALFLVWLLVALESWTVGHRDM